MSNFEVDDVHRSLRRFISQVLTPPWRIRMERQPVTPDERELCVVEPASPTTTGHHRTSIPQGNIEKRGAYSAMAYPAMGASARESRLEAQRVAQLLEDAFDMGLLEDDREVGGPRRVPVYDFLDVPVTGTMRAGPPTPYGYAWVDDLTVRSLQDTLDPLRFTVACDVRLSWERSGRIEAPSPVAGSMHGSFKRP